MKYYKELRQNIENFLKENSLLLDKEGMLLDIAPQDHAGAKACFKTINIHTFDLNADANPDIVGDISKYNESIKEETYDVIVCTEVLEHVYDFQNAIKEMYRILKKGGTLLVSTPFNLRIHGPKPDLWRFTNYGLKHILKEFESVNVEALETPDRELMPIGLTAVAKK